jgi:hypothetical protein
MPTSHYVWVVRAFSMHDDEGWVRVFNQFRDEELAWTAVALFWDLMVEHGDYFTVDVIRTISFKRDPRNFSINA